MAVFGDDEILDGIPLVEEEEEPTRTVERRDGATRRAVRDPEDPPTVRAIPAAKPRWVEGASVHSLVGSEEALRVFEELSNPGESMVTFSGGQVEESRAQTIPPQEHGPVNSDGATQEISFIEPLDAASLPPPLPSDVPLLESEVGSAAYRDAYLVFEHTPCPLFRLDDQGRIQLANTALCRFLSLAKEDALGLGLHKTRLGQIYPDLEEDLDEALATRTMLQQVVSYQDATGASVRFLIWIVPFPPSAGRSNAFSGIILPYPG